MENYEGIERIGRGSFCASFLVLHKAEKKKYVLKKIRLSKITEKFRSTANQEIQSISKLRQSYLVEYKDSWVEKGNCICIVADYCEGGNISERIRKTRGSYFSEEKICKWLTQMLLAIDYLHTNRVLHRNVKLTNILVTKENDILLSDFGLGKFLHKEGHNSTVIGTPNYMCPEILENIPYGYKSDIWSLGCCIFEIAAHQQAFKAPDMVGLINKINLSLISPFPYVYSLTLKQIIKSMLRKNPEHRPTAAELLRHPHLKPFLLRCRNLPTVFLPVKSPPNNMEKTSDASSGYSDGGKFNQEAELKLKQKELLPLFDENDDIENLNLLDGEVLIEDKLETKRVDPTSYSGNVFHDSEDSKSGCKSCETTTCNVQYVEIVEFSPHEKSFNSKEASILPSTVPLEKSEKSPIKNATEVEETITNSDKSIEDVILSSPLVEDKLTKEKVAVLEKCSELLSQGTLCNDRVEKASIMTEETETSKVDVEPRASQSVAENIDATSPKITETSLNRDLTEIKENHMNDKTPADKGVIHLINQSPGNDSLSSAEAALVSDAMNIEWINKENRRANALESLLELCARLLKQDKLDELTGVLKAFGDDTVSSRETAISLTKSLINAQKFAEES